MLHAVEIFYILLNWNWFYDILELELKSTQTILQDLGWLCDILNVDSKDTRAKLLDSDWLHYDQAGMMQQKYESILQLSVKQLKIQASLATSISLDKTMLGVWKNHVWCEKNQMLISYLSLIWFRLKDKSKSLFKMVAQVVCCHLFQEICMKSWILSPCVHPFREMPWFSRASQRSKVQLAPLAGNICEIIPNFKILLCQNLVI